MNDAIYCWFIANVKSNDKDIKVFLFTIKNYGVKKLKIKHKDILNQITY